MTSEQLENTVYHLEADVPVSAQSEYVVKYTGDYKAFDMVEVYLQRDAEKFPLAAYPAYFIATGKIVLEDIDANSNNDSVPV